MDAASDNTKDQLRTDIRIELMAFEPTMVALQKEVAKLAAGGGSPAQIAIAAEKLGKAAKVKARADAVLNANPNGDANGTVKTRNTAGGALKAVMKFTGRCVRDEAAALWLDANAPKAAPAKAAK